MTVDDSAKGPLFLVVDEDPDTDASTTLYDAAGAEVEVAVLTLNGYYASKHCESSERIEYLLASLDEARENREQWPAPVLERAIAHAKTVAARTDVRLDDGSWVDVSVDWDLLYVTGPLVAHLSVEAMLDGQPIEISTRDELEWDCTDAVAHLDDPQYRASLLAALAAAGETVDRDDLLPYDPSVATWVREQPGGPTIHIRYAF